jgi:hypothetical protein
VKAPAAPDAQVAVPFPVRGLDQDGPFCRQPGGTAADARNVRSYDYTAERERGGSRPGLRKFRAAPPTPE